MDDKSRPVVHALAAVRSRLMEEGDDFESVKSKTVTFGKLCEMLQVSDEDLDIATFTQDVSAHRRV